jgi:hypothetical protein
MKNFFILYLTFLCFTFKAQTKDTAKAILNGNCLISGGQITVNDYSKIKRLCPPKLVRVIRFKVTRVPKGKSVKNGDTMYIECLGGDIPYLDPVKPGDTVFFDEIVGLNEIKKRSASESIVLNVK